MADGCDDFGKGVDVVGFGAIVGVVLLLIQPLIQLLNERLGFRTATADHVETPKEAFEKNKYNC